MVAFVGGVAALLLRTQPAERTVAREQGSLLAPISESDLTMDVGEAGSPPPAPLTTPGSAGSDQDGDGPSPPAPPPDKGGPLTEPPGEPPPPDDGLPILEELLENRPPPPPLLPSQVKADVVPIRGGRR